MSSLNSLGLSKDPLLSFSAWMRAAEAAGIAQPEAMSLATVDESGLPSVRTVLFKGLSDGGFRFFTNYNSPKGQDLQTNPHAALLFFWQAQARQVRITGHIEKLSASESQAYFASRDRGSRLGAWASDQSSPIASRDELLAKFAALETEFEGQEIPCPSHWGGYKVVPRLMEFWQGQGDRLHDRFVFTLGGSPADGTDATPQWLCQRLAP